MKQSRRNPEQPEITFKSSFFCQLFYELRLKLRNDMVKILEELEANLKFDSILQKIDGLTAIFFLIYFKNWLKSKRIWNNFEQFHFINNFRELRLWNNIGKNPEESETSARVWSHDWRGREDGDNLEDKNFWNTIEQICDTSQKFGFEMGGEISFLSIISWPLRGRMVKLEKYKTNPIQPYCSKTKIFRLIS